TPGSFSTASLTPPIYLPVDAYPRQVVLGDLDGDGHGDLVVATEGGFAAFRNLDVPGSLTSNSFASKVVFPLGYGAATRIALGDLDGDGKPDLAAQIENSSIIAVRQNRSTAGILNTSSFGPEVDFITAATTSPNRGVVTADVDGDGNPELLLLN